MKPLKKAHHSSKILMVFEKFAFPLWDFAESENKTSETLLVKISQEKIRPEQVEAISTILSVCVNKLAKLKIGLRQNCTKLHDS